ncbi:gas vesicle protein GvpJ [Micromonospora halophytica]|uniref:Gas vesicle protein n=1 Tax=Micromonospora halophytica TaxID=47864 RepID=A0A1C5ITD3_9ACTN|nr:gas vesicle protein GvpJ [Micromonospora halophytica]SCG61590.1 Gas vesicle protein [Micromonospora halophytica]
MTSPRQPSVVQNTGQVMGAGHEPANLGDILERVLDRGIVIAGDIRVSLLDIELLTLKLRLVIASVDTARQIGIDWWEHDPWLSSKARPPVEPGPRDPEQVEAERRPRVARRVAREEWNEYDG